MRISPEAPNWTASIGHEGSRDDGLLLVNAWFANLIGQAQWDNRLAAVEDHFRQAREKWAQGNLVALYNTRDTLAWYGFQANAFAQDRANWVPDEAVRVLPTFTRFALDFETLIAIPGAEERAARLATRDRAQPDGGLYELLVALAYRRNGWQVEFVPEKPGISRTPDFIARQNRRRWAVECKRIDRSLYHQRERKIGQRLSQPVHQLALGTYRSIAVFVDYQVELAALPDDYLLQHVQAYFNDPRERVWMDGGGFGSIAEIDWSLFHNVLAKDSVYFGSSRMIELLLGAYDHDLDYSFSARWRPDRRRTFWADAVYQASVMSWRSSSHAALKSKSTHFTRVVAKASQQLPGDMPGVVHVGAETWGGKLVDALRHYRNIEAMRRFDASGTRLRWLYANYIAPEVSTRQNESWAIEETAAFYRVGRHHVPQPLPDHTLFSAPDESHHGAHWD